ncbi:MAG TPA: peptidoglycan-associated lipoprotein Pal [Thermoanaerobaculia bacterium]|nr:peptidoglycan-associated lipoprotein Pal [Thermoanaerobaculia bacterium]HUM29072.1 peptidoglycan-associated lipoprotein Pal [Thermoanaerobaculia bacterium]HXK67372.1 peptidoglycan-associated lipoprotein Pal [Thermoanaerobaculia bacterium]
MRHALLLTVTLISLTLVLACAHKKAAPPAPEPPAVEEPAPAPEPPAQEVKPEVVKPVQEPQPKEEIPSDVAELNRKGYLKDVYFEFDKYDLKEDSRTGLAANAEWLRKFSTIKIMIEGHCDERGTREYNLSLGEKRASAAMDYLVSLGVDASRVDVISYGEDRPFSTCHDESCWSQNRRAHFVITAR